MRGRGRGLLLAVACLGTLAASVLPAGATPGGATPNAGPPAYVAAPALAATGRRVGQVSGAQAMRIEIVLPLRHPRQAAALATAVSTPGSARHGRFLTATQFTARFAATAAQVSRVRAWLGRAGLRVAAVSPTRRTVTATGTATQVGAAFGTRVAWFQAAGQTRAGLVGPVFLPASVRGDVAGVLGVEDTLMHPDHQVADLAAVPARPAVSPAAADTACTAFWGQHNNTAVPQVVPAPLQSNRACGYAGAQLQALYGASSTGGGGQRVVVVDAYASATMAADLARYSQLHGLPAPAAGQFQQVLPAGGFINQAACEPNNWAIEESLDVEAVHTLAPASGITYVASRDCATSNLLDAVGRAVDGHLGSVVSASWGHAGEDTAAARQAADQIFIEAALTGIGVYVSTGDDGTNSPASVDFPASSPWVTAVGGTTMGLSATNTRIVETGWEDQADTLVDGQWRPAGPPTGPLDGGAGGGRSAVYAEPSWQAAVVPAALAGGHRVLPDISALADPHTGMTVDLTANGQLVGGPVGGTSLAAPLLAALVADAQQAHGMTVGLATPALYAMAGTAGVRDVGDVHAAIYSAESSTGATGDFLAETDRNLQGLQARPGFDPVTGVGTPNGPAFAAGLAG